MKYQTLPIPFARPKQDVLRWEDVNWRKVMLEEEFLMLGLCNRHVEIDNTGRDWFGLPLIVDPVAAPVQGIPYVVELRSTDERELNEHLWTLRMFEEGPRHFWARHQYSCYLKTVQPGQGFLSREQHYLQAVIRQVRAHVLPNPRIARLYVEHETLEELIERSDAAEQIPHHRYASNAEKFSRLGFLDRIMLCLEGLIRSCRQRLIFVKLQRQYAEARRDQRAEQQRESHQHWTLVDQQRTKAKQQALTENRILPPAEQLAMF